MTPPTRKVRFVCVSDTHNSSPADGAFKLPPGDVLVHAGDLTKHGSYVELKNTLDWIHAADYKIKLVVAGNHDVTLDKDFYEQYGREFHNQHLQDPQASIDLIKSYSDITYFQHQYIEKALRFDDGSWVNLRVFGSPFSPKKGLWAFGYNREEALLGDSTQNAGLWDQIPLTTDIVVVHTPPKFHCDEARDESLGCEGLRQALWRVRPSLAICGHVHEARGAQRVTWDLMANNIKYKEDTTGVWQDPGEGNKKQSLLDVSHRSRRPLLNTGPFDGHLGSPADDDPQPDLPIQPGSASYQAGKGLGGDPSAHRGDTEALNGRLGRQETCIINCAIMGTSWPYKTPLQGGRKYHKPVVVDLDLSLGQPA